MRAIILSKAYCSTNNEKQTLSITLQNIINTSKYPIGSDRRLLAIIDSNPPVTSLERKLFEQIQEIVDTTLRSSKSFEYILSSDKIWGGK